MGGRRRVIDLLPLIMAAVHHRLLLIVHDPLQDSALDGPKPVRIAHL